MAGLGGFIQGLGLAIGNDMIQGQNYQNKQADIELKKTEVQQAQMQQQQMQQQMKAEKDIGAFIQSQTQLEGADAALPMNQAKLYNKAAGLAASQGALGIAKEMTELSKQATQEGMEQTKALAIQQAAKKETLATTASSLPDQPSPDQMADLVRKAVDAGVDPLTIPPPGSPALMKWKNDMTLAGMDSKSKAEFIQKGVEMKLTRDQHEKDHMDNVATARASQQATAVYREGLLQMDKQRLADSEEARRDRATHKQIIKLADGDYEPDPDMKLPGERNSVDPTLVKISDPALTSAQKQGVSRGSFAAAEISRGLVNVSKLDTTSANSPFTHLNAHTPFEALIKTGATALTPDQSRMIDVAAAGLGNQLASLDSSLGGRMAAGKSQEDLQTAAVRQAGDSGFTAAYKLANAKELTLTALRHLPGNYKNTPDGKAQIEEIEKSLPFTTDDVLAAMRKDPKASDTEIKALVAASARLHDKAESEAKTGGDTGGVGLPGGADPGKGTNAPPLPAGWTVTAH